MQSLGGFNLPQVSLAQRLNLFPGPPNLPRRVESVSNLRLLGQSVYGPKIGSL